MIEYQCLHDNFGLVSKRPWEPNLNLLLEYHLETDGKTKKKEKILEDILRMYMMDEKKCWE
jgi:hypothetical protein